MRMCPSAVVIEPRHKLYYEVSGQIMEIFGSITELVEPLSVDEAFLDVGGAIRRLGPPREIGELIRARVRSELGITASVGIAASKFVAKIASTRCKPNGLLLIGPEETVPYLHSLPVSALWGVGAKTVDVLARMGIRTVADVAASPLPSLRKVLGVSGEHVYRLSWGIDPRPVTPVRLEKSIGAEETFAVDTADEALLHRELLRLSHRTAERLRSAGMHARTVALKLRYADFSTITRSRTVSTPIDSAQLLYAVAVQLLESLGDRPMTVRLVGIRAEQLEEAAQAPLQLSLDRRDDNWRAAEQVLDQVTRKFGTKSVLPARLLDRDPDRQFGLHPVRGPKVPVTKSRGRSASFRTGRNKLSLFIRRFGTTGSSVRTNAGPAEHPARGRGKPISTNDGEWEPRANPARCGFRDTGRVSLDVGRLKEVVMPLSEHEQKLLEQLEKQLHEDDPKFASSMGSDAGRSWSTRHLVIGVLATLAGVVLLLFRRDDPEHLRRRPGLCGHGRRRLLRHDARFGCRQSQSRGTARKSGQAQEFVHEQS